MKSFRGKLKYLVFVEVNIVEIIRGRLGQNKFFFIYR
jgi:hypothetical protein